MLTMAVSSTTISWARAMTTRARPRLRDLVSIPVAPQFEYGMPLGLPDEVGHRRVGGKRVKTTKEGRLQGRLQARPQHLVQDWSGSLRSQFESGNRLVVPPSTEDSLPCRAQVPGPVGLPERRQQPATPVVLEQPDRGGSQLAARPAAHREQSHGSNRNAGSKQTQDQWVEGQDVPGNLRGSGHFNLPPLGYNCSCRYIFSNSLRMQMMDSNKA